MGKCVADRVHSSHQPQDRSSQVFTLTCSFKAKALDKCISKKNCLNDVCLLGLKLALQEVTLPSVTCRRQSSCLIAI